MKDFNGKIPFITGDISRLNELKIPPLERMLWFPKTVIKIVSRKCYTGEAEYSRELLRTC